ncbi:MAG TPA: biotin--[acetyl-CoA-carboxylase] ligase [Candidatus Dormibacteraeota bacterium]|nr:biotin--[acetyl-CoA-carboxylase] ligase [Candidatus Dormibacteraeota bacterium]
MGKAQPKVVRLGSVTSTQDVGRDLPIGTIVVADHQEAGRGRTGRRWEAAPGTALLVSFVVRPNRLLSLAAGVAAAEACGPQVRLKWPNDLLVAGRKLGGILVEASPAKAVCGIGINLTSAPKGAAMLERAADELLARLIEKMDLWCSAPPEAVIGRWRELSATLGRRVRVDLPGESFEGVADDLGEGGELIVDGRAVFAGSVTHL